MENHSPPTSSGNTNQSARASGREHPMGEPVQLIPAGSQLWAEYLHTTCHDFYYSEAYHDFMQEQGYGEAWLAVVGSREKSLIWPFLLRNVNPASAPPQKGMRDITSVYGYAGPLASGCAP